VTRYLCHECATKAHVLKPLATTELTGSTVQLEKYIKHTAPTGSYGINSVLDDPRYETYRDYIVTAHASGSVEIDNLGRVNIVWAAAEATGLTFKDGAVVAVTDAVKVVLHDKEMRVHAYPTGSHEFTAALCSECGQSAVG
jgi:hypothetical protein